MNIPHIAISKRRPGQFFAAIELLQRNLRLLKIVRRFAPDLLVASAAGISTGPVGLICRIPSLVFDQVDFAPIQNTLGMPLATFICTGDGFLNDYGPRHIRFRGLLAQAYLDPRRFTPDPEPLRQAGINPHKPYIVLRLVRFAANHDFGIKGLTTSQIRSLIQPLTPYGRVLISSEDPLPDQLKHYQNPVPPENLHDLLAFAALCIAEGGTVAPEAGILGTPAICCNAYNFGYLSALENDHHLILRPPSLDKAVELATNILKKDNLKKQWADRRDRFFQQTDDVASFMRQTVDRVALHRPLRRSHS